MNMGNKGNAYTCLRCTYAGIRETKMQMEKEDRHMSRVVCTSIGTVTYMYIQFVGKEERKQKGGLGQNTKRAARATQVERQVEKKACTHDTDS